VSAASRIGDVVATGHGCDGTTTIADSNTDHTVHANGIPIIVVGAPTVAHNTPPGPCHTHTAVTNTGSASVFINGIAISRIGDSTDAGTMISGSPNVFIGG